MIWHFVSAKLIRQCGIVEYSFLGEWFIALKIRVAPQHDWMFKNKYFDSFFHLNIFISSLNRVKCQW